MTVGGRMRGTVAHDAVPRKETTPQDARHARCPGHAQMLAATAFGVGAAVLTRNVRDFALTPVRVETY